MSLGLVLFLAWSAGLQQVIARLRHVDWALAALVVVILTGQVFFAACRWQEVAKMFGPERPLLDFVRFTFIAQFFNQLLPAGVGGDAARIWLYHKVGASIREASLAIVADRFLGVFMLFVIVAVALLVFQEQLGDPRLRQSGLAFSTIGLLACGGVVLAGLAPKHWLGGWRVARLAHDMSDGLRRLLSSVIGGSKVVGLSLLVHLISVLAVSILAAAMDLSVDFGLLMVAVPVSLLAAAIPISIGGWGLREGVLVAILSAHGVEPDLALSLSFLFGLTFVMVGVVGAAVWLAYKPPALGAERVVAPAGESAARNKRP